MTDIYMLRIPQGLVPAQDSDRELLKKIKVGVPVRVKVTRVRNYKFHCKYFSLLTYAFECWEPSENKADKLMKVIKIAPERNFEMFRSDVAILAGYYTATYRLNGDVRLQAKSISFGSMDEDTFEGLYTKTIDVIVRHVLTQYDGEMLRGILEQIEGFET